MTKTTVIHHSADFDGIFCREIARKFLPEAELIGWDYGNPPIPMPPEGQVYVLDLSPDCLCDHAALTGTIWNRLVWIDHHKSAIDKYEAKGFPKISGYRIDGVAACRLAWQWFMVHHVPQDQELPRKEKFIEREVDEPLAVRLAGEYDIWDKRDPNADLFQMGLRSRNLGPDTWDILLSGPTDPQGDIYVDTLLSAGEGVQFYVREQNESIIKAAGFTIEFEGLKFLACNHARYNSHLFTAGLTPEHDGCFGFAWRDGQWAVSLYHAPGKEHHDLSKIAAKYGGGGHRGACGFRAKTLPFFP